MWGLVTLDVFKAEAERCMIEGMNEILPDHHPVTMDMVVDFPYPREMASVSSSIRPCLSWSKTLHLHATDDNCSHAMPCLLCGHVQLAVQHPVLDAR